MKGKSWGTILGVVFGFLLAGATTQAAAAERVAVLPLAIYSQEDLAYLKKNVLETLHGNLSRQKISLVPLAEVEPWLTKPIPSAWDELRSAGKDLGADKIIFGSLTKIGQRLTLSGNLLEVRGDRPPLTFSLSEDGLENILKLTERFSKELTLKLSGLQKIVSLQIKGNQRIEGQAIERELKSKPGDAYQAEVLDQDLRAIFKMGFFSDVRLETEAVPEGRQVVFVVTERPFVKKIELKGNKELKEEELKDQLTLKPFAIMNLNTVNESLEKLNTFYQSKGYYNAQINHTIQSEEEQSVTVTFNITEGKKVYIKTIAFQGAEGLQREATEGHHGNQREGFSLLGHLFGAI